MKQPATKIERQRTAIIRNAVHRKKLIAAAVLLMIMTALWVRVFTGKSKPTAVTAAPAAEQSKISTVQNESVEYVQLPHISDRHDAIMNDIFSSENFRWFNRQDQYSTDTKRFVTGSTIGDSPAASAAAALKLVAIVNDKKPQAFIENRLFEKGDNFRFMFNGQIYQFKILDILEDKVVFDCNGTIITKKIPQPF